MPSFKLRISSMPLFEAASISTTSSARPSSISVQGLHLLQGSPFFAKVASFARVSQFASFATILAALVLPVPLGP